MNTKRLETSRLFHRFGFGPRPGEYSQALKDGVDATRIRLTTAPATQTTISPIALPEITDLGKRPEPNTPEVVPFAIAMRTQEQQMGLWWLDMMALSDHGLTERMTWFWHGHWATSIQKLNYPLPMFNQNKTLRAQSLGNFNTMVKAMLNDGALQLWLDGQDSTAKAPNENLGRELMELFVLGVNRYTEDDVKAISRALTGYQVVRSTGLVSINQGRRDANPVTLLGTTASFTGDSLSDFLVARDDCATFIAERLWYRFISSTEPMPATFSAKSAFATRDISAAIKAMAADPSMQDLKYALVKSPVEWFISACRALELTPSKLQTPTQLASYLDKLGQVPFNPPNVGGWPAGEAWLSSATAQYRLAFAAWLIKQSNLDFLNQIPRDSRVLKSADWLGVPEWSARTQSALRTALDDPTQFTLLALCSPEYIVSA
ncbi:MAG: DUF1800 family protein [Actinomycetales bacterium]|nr:DUF1800 family protein [Actinomycetales bacterium]